MAFNFQRPNLPYEGESLQNDKRYQILEAKDQPPTAQMLDADFDYLIDATRTLDAAMAGLSIGTIPGAGLPENANRLPVTDGSTNISWVLISDQYVEDESISASKLLPGTLTALQMMDGTITAPKLAPNCVTTVKILDFNITANKLAPDAVTTIKILDENVTTPKIADDAVTTGKIPDNAITTPKILDGNVTTPKIADGNVTLAKLATTVLNALLPIGGIIEYAASTAPSANFLECNGQAVSRTTYAALFALIGTTYGVGDGSTTFGLPDRRGRVSVGIGSDNSTGGRITAATASNITLGGTFGAETHTLTIAQMPSHTHNVPSISGAVTGSTRNTASGQIGDITTNPAGGDQPHNNTQPSVFMRYYIRAL